MNNLAIEHARLMFKNFAGKESRYNPAGRRNFCVVIEDPKVVEDMKRDGWNVKTIEPKEGYSDPLSYLSVSVNFDNIPPKIFLINTRKRTKTPLTEETVNVLDYADISNVDLIVTPYQWSVGDKKGVKGYLKTMYVTLEEDEFASKYEDDWGESEAFPGQDDEEMPF